MPGGAGMRAGGVLTRPAGRAGLVLRTIYALCLLGATGNHLAAIARHGLLWDYGGLPRASATFWTMLTVLDPAAAILLFRRPNPGIVATAAIIVADVGHNLWIEARYFPPLLHALAGEPRLVEQIAFMVFVAATAPFAWEPPRRGAR